MSANSTRPNLNWQLVKNLHIQEQMFVEGQEVNKLKVSL